MCENAHGAESAVLEHEVLETKKHHKNEGSGVGAQVVAKKLLRSKGSGKSSPNPEGRNKGKNGSVMCFRR